MEPPARHAQLPAGQREFAAEISWDLPNLADAVLTSSARFIGINAATSINNTVQAMARNVSPSATFNLSQATLPVAVTKRCIP